MTGFITYVRVDTAFHVTMCKKAASGQSIVLLGESKLARTFLLHRIAEALTKEGCASLVVDFSQCGDHNAEAQVQERIRSLSGLTSQTEADSSFILLGPLARPNCPGPLFLIASGIDSIPHRVARQLLQEIRVMVSEISMVAILSDGHNLGELVYGPSSEFNVASQYVLQGFAPSEFRVVLMQAMRNLNPECCIDDTAASVFWRETAGSIRTFEHLALSVLESRSFGDVGGTDLSDISDAVENEIVLDAFAHRFFADARQLISQEPSCWSNLTTLLNGELPTLGDPSGPPDALTLSGVAIREKGALAFSSPIVAKCAKRYFTSTRLGDLYASQGQWDQAFAEYRQQTPVPLQRPTTFDDKGTVEPLVRAFYSLLHSRVVDGSDAIKALFTEGCRLLLGFRDVLFWKWTSEWQPVGGRQQ